jgi:protein SDA1
MMLRKKNMIPPLKCITFMMKLFNCPDKMLRKIIFKFIIKDIKDQNSKSKAV